jgi:hypothetical protein
MVVSGVHEQPRCNAADWKVIAIAAVVRRNGFSLQPNIFFEVDGAMCVPSVCPTGRSLAGLILWAFLARPLLVYSVSKKT